MYIWLSALWIFFYVLLDPKIYSNLKSQKNILIIIIEKNHAVIFLYHSFYTDSRFQDGRASKRANELPFSKDLFNNYICIEATFLKLYKCKWSTQSNFDVFITNKDFRNLLKILYTSWYLLLCGMTPERYSPF